MILTCPKCATRYLTQDDSIGPNGKTVRCTRCETTWFVAADLDELGLKDNQAIGLTAASVAAGKPSDVKKQPENKPPKLAIGTLDQAQAPITDQLSENTRGAHVEIRDRADDKRRRQRLRTVGMIWLIPIFILCMAAGLTYMMRQDIVRKIPATATLYKQLGIDVSLSGLSLEDPVTRTTLIEGKTLLVVNGAVRNISNSAQDVPLIKFSLHDKSGTELTSWFVETETKSLEKNGRVTYVSEYPNPPLDAVAMRYKFEDSYGAISKTIEEPPAG